MNTMLVEEGITFKEFEQKTFQMICEWGQQFTKEFLEKYDEYLMETRDKKAYRHKGLKKTTIKTRYGEVEYEGTVTDQKSVTIPSTVTLADGTKCKVTTIAANAFKGAKSSTKITVLTKNEKTYKKVVKKLQKAGAKKATFKYKKSK